MSRIKKTFTAPVPPPPSSKATKKNREGYPAFSRPLEERYLQTLLTNTFGDTFYADAKTLVKESAEIHEEMLDKDPVFAARALEYARLKGYMRSQPMFGLAKLSRKNTELFKSIFDRIVRTPNDARDFMQLVAADGRGEGGAAVKKTVGKWLVKRLNEYWVIKYGSEGKSGYSLANLIRTTHPVFGKPNPLVQYLFDREADLSAFPQLRAFEALKKATTDAEKVKCITEGRLPHEVASSFAGKSLTVWTAIMPQMPIFALLKNLATLERHGVFGSREFVKRTVDKLSNVETIQKSMILPFRFLEAMKHVKNDAVRDALRDAVDIAFSNVPDIHGDLTVMLDVSGSMDGDYLQKGSLFALASMKKAGTGRFMTFDTEAYDVPFSKRDSILTQAEKIHTRGGTDVGAPLRKLLKEKYKTDNILLITDEQQNAGSPVVDVFTKYRQQVNAQAKLFILDIAPYGSASTPTMPGVWYSYGWSPTALQFIGLTSKGWDTQVESVRKGLFGNEDAEKADSEVAAAIESV